MVRHQKLSNFYDIAVQTEQIGDIKISEEAINDKKALIVTVAFITGFILSIFLVFFILKIFYSFIVFSININ